MKPRRLATLTLVLAGLACASPEKQIEASRRYQSITYNDTTIESFGRTDRAVTGVLVSGPGDSVRFRIRAAQDDLVAGVDITLHPATSRDEAPRTARVGMPKGTVPLMGTSVAFLEQLLRRARAVGGDSVTIPVMQVGAQASLEVFTVIQNGSDSVVLVGADGNQTMGLHLAVDGQGRILGGVIPASGSKIQSLDAAQ
ncbi:MAG TPA: hypothetical protein VNG35_03065 [Gemmatimonadales bacterium]|nr:hypothetical protein [Gemmatimonadales bacterium]